MGKSVYIAEVCAIERGGIIWNVYNFFVRSRKKSAAARLQREGAVSRDIPERQAGAENSRRLEITARPHEHNHPRFI